MNTKLIILIVVAFAAGEARACSAALARRAWLALRAVRDQRVDGLLGHGVAHVPDPVACLAHV